MMMCRVLLCEDDALVRHSLRRLLEQVGYEVSSFDSADAALDVLGNRVAAFDILLTDLQMPGMKGNELSSWLRRLNPHIRVALMSGSFQHDAADEVSGEVQIAKPFRVANLLARMRELEMDTQAELVHH